MGMDILVISSNRSAYDLELSRLEKSLVDNWKHWLLVAAVEPWLAGEGERGLSYTVRLGGRPRHDKKWIPTSMAGRRGKVRHIKHPSQRL